MISKKQTSAARQNIKKPQVVRKRMSARAHAISQPEGKNRAQPGTTGRGKYFRIVVRPKELFTSFRYHDVGVKGHIERLSGRRRSGSWATQAWLISKKDTHISGGTLVADTNAAQNVLDTLGSAPKQIQADVFAAKDRSNIPEKDKPTSAQKRAWQKNILKAQAGRILHA